MKRATQLIPFLITLLALILSGCGGRHPSPPGALPNADHLVKFDENGVAVLRGRITAGAFTTDTSQGLKENIRLYIPARVQGIASEIIIDFPLSFESEFSSSLHSLSTVREYHIFHPFEQVGDAFPRDAQADVTFRKKDDGIEVISFHEVFPRFALFKRRAIVDGVIPTNVFSEGVLAAQVKGHVASISADHIIVDFYFSAPITIQGIPADVRLRFSSAPDTEIILLKGTFSREDGETPDGYVTVKFTRKGNKLIAHQITQLP